MTFEILGTAHLGQARCICATNPKGCPIHQRAEQVSTCHIDCGDCVKFGRCFSGYDPCPGVTLRTESDDSVPRHEAADIDWAAVYEQHKGRRDGA